MSGGIESGGERPSKALLWAVGLSAIWVVLLAVAVAWSKSCAPDAAFWQVGSRFLSCLSANEIGDFLAGASAPLAFIWLVVTVLVQAQELRAQRDELRLTRQEFADNRKVAEATRKEIAEQAESARKNAEYLGTQTRLLSDQHAHQQQMIVDETFAGLLEQLETFLASRFHLKPRYSDPTISPDPPFHAGEFNSNLYVRLSQRSSDIIGRMDSVRDNPGLEVCSIDNRSVGLLEELLSQLERLCNMLDEASPVSRTLADTVRLLELRQTVEEVLQMMKRA